ncbi:hypothetical protein V3C99_006824 [Haemonchus contortus]
MSVDELRDAADYVLRSVCIESLTLSPGEYSTLDTYNLDPTKVSVDPLSLLDGIIRPTEPATLLCPLIDSEGKFSDVVEYVRDADEFGTSTVSMSLNRSPASDTTSIKGSSSNVPFYPGGFDSAFGNVMAFTGSEETTECDENTFFRREDLLVCAPGMKRGLDLVLPTKSQENKEPTPISDGLAKQGEINFDSADLFDLMDFVGGGAPLIVPTESHVEEKENEKENKREDKPKPPVEQKEQDSPVMKDVEAALEKELPKPAAPLIPPERYAYAKQLDPESCSAEYKAFKSIMAKKYPFELDGFQQAAVVCMEKGESVFVAAHTSAGKTVVAEYAVALCEHHKTRAIYTSPIKALSNQKFRDFKMMFTDVGLVTGDIQLFPDAFCLIMTTEILRSMLYNGSEVVRDLEWVVFDEVHYINNAERGHVWEEVLIMLPSHVKIVMLSATVPNCIEFADWVGRIKNRKINVVSTLKRPVPLEHYLYTGQDGKTKKDLFKIVDMNGNWQEIGYRKAAETKANKRDPPANQARQGGGQDRGDGANRGRGGQARGGQARGGHSVSTGGFSGKPTGKNDKNVYISLIDFLRTNEQLPMVVFVFSRKRCDDNAQLLTSMDLTTEVEKSHILTFFTQCINRLKGSDKMLPQVHLMKELCMRGFAVHHSGILPILKEVVELLFQKGYVKILFATETFAMGVNMPARTVVFDSIQKHDGMELRTLNAAEYIQMAGRAGRRGLDTTGTVIVLCKQPKLVEPGQLQLIMMGKAAPLVSQFRVTYSMLLNLLRVEHLRVEDMLQRSFVESASLREGPKRKSNLEKAQKELSALPKIECQMCDPGEAKVSPLRQYHDVLVNFIERKSELWQRLASELTMDKRLKCGRVLLVSSAHHNLQNQLVLLVKEMQGEGKRAFQVMVPCWEQDSNVDEQKRRADEFLRLPKEEQEWLEESCVLEGLTRWGIEAVAPLSPDGQNGQRSFRMVNDLSPKSLIGVSKKLLKIDVADVLNEAKTREIPRLRTRPISESVMRIILEMDNLTEEWRSTGSQLFDLAEDVSVSDIDLAEHRRWFLRIREELLDPTRHLVRNCMRFQQHMKALRERVRIERQISRLQYSLSMEALQLSEEYQKRIEVLKALDFVDATNMVTFKGRVACEIHHQELLITELILSKKLHEKSPAEVAAMFSATTCQYKSGDGPQFEKDSIFYQLKEDVQSTNDWIEGRAALVKATIADVGDELRYDLMEVVYHWASGMPFSEIMAMTDAQEGLIVRCIQRLGEVCKDVRNAARIVGDPALHEKMEQVSAAIKRDIVFAASLYTSM